MSDQTTEIFGSFFLNASEFALEVKHIQEVVNPPASLSSMPLAPDYLLGIFNLRGSIIPVVDLKHLLKIQTNDLPFAEKKIAIVIHEGLKIGLLFDQTGEILTHRFERNDFHYAHAGDEKDLVSGALKLDEGKRIVQILNIFAMFKLESIPHAKSEIAANLKRGKRIQCISFLVAGHRFGLGIDSIQEILKVPSLNESALAGGNCVGIFELRGDVVPLIDFASILKYRAVIPLASLNEDHRVIVMKIGDEKFGVLVDAVDSILTYYKDEILDLPTFFTGKPSLFSGFLSQGDGRDLILLNQPEILSSSDIGEITRGHHKIYQSNTEHASEDLKKKADRKSYITFKIDNLFAIDIKEVKEIIECPEELLHPPGVSKNVKGILNLRGSMIVVLNTRHLYAMDEKELSDASKVLIFEKNGTRYGLIVDSVESIATFSESAKIKLPEVLYKVVGGSRINEDVKFAAETEHEGVATTLLVLDLAPLALRLESGKPPLNTLS